MTLNVVTRLGLIPSCWCLAISVMIEKDAGNPNINRLRIIHLFEADYTLFLKIIWASCLVKRGEEANQFGEAQQGSRQNRAANDAVLLKRLTYDLSRILRSNLGTFDNDAKSCYDRIINSIAMLAAKRLGMPDTVIATHAGILWALQYSSRRCLVYLKVFTKVMKIKCSLGQDKVAVHLQQPGSLLA